MISGYLTLNNKKNLNIKVFYYKKFKRVVIPFIIWTILYSIYNSIRLYGNLDLIYIIKINIMAFCGIESHYHLWFFYSLIILYAISPILIKLLDVLSDKDIIILIVLFIIQNNIIKIINSIIEWNSKWNIPIADYTIIYYIIGGFIGKVGIEYLKKYKKMIYIISWITLITSIFISYIYTGISGEVALLFSDRDFFTAAITSIGVFIYILDKNYNINSNLSRFFLYIAKYGLGVYLIHPMIINLIQFINKNKSIGSLIIESVLAVAISYLCVYTIKKVPI